MSASKKFQKLLEPGRIGRITTKNRIIKTTSSMGYQYDEKDGHMTERQLYFSEAIARGGVGLMISEGGIFDWPIGAHDVFHYRIDDDEYIPGWAKLAEVIHKHGCPLFAQMVHAGPWHRKEMDGNDPVASTADIRVEEGGRPSTTRALTVPQIKEIVGKYAAGAERYRKAGLDGVEINASGNHLLNSFLSRGFNKRHDEYGCDTLENRSRIVVEIIREIKTRTGEDFTVGVIFNGAEYGVENGLTIEETKVLAGFYQRAGVDYLQVRIDGVGKYLSSHYPELIFYPEPPEGLDEMLDKSHHGAGLYVPLAAAIKKMVNIPVVAVGRLDPILGEKILEQGRADFIGMNKRLLADPELPHKVAAGKLVDIAPCTACEHCISFRVYRYPVRCRINAALGGNEDYTVKKAAQKKQVVVVGGGPAGMETARVAALRGHEVILFEKEAKLGGLLPLAGLVKGLEGEDLVALVKYLDRQLKMLGVTKRMVKEFQPSEIELLKPDAVVLAVGGKPCVPEIPGIKRSNVISGPELHSKLKLYLRFFSVRFLRWLTKFWMPVGRNVVVIGGAIQGAELAEFLVKRGRKVTIVAGDEDIGEGLPRRKQQRLVDWLKEKRVKIITHVKYEEITDQGLVITTKDGVKQTIAADTITPASPFTPNTELFEALKGKISEIHLIGDGQEPRLIIDAIADGWRIAKTI
ncbi:MAG: FAD-dependent oxidoreductase [Dehalococcoidales bacterium]